MIIWCIFYALVLKGGADLSSRAQKPPYQVDVCHHGHGSNGHPCRRFSWILVEASFDAILLVVTAVVGMELYGYQLKRCRLRGNDLALHATIFARYRSMLRSTSPSSFYFARSPSSEGQLVLLFGSQLPSPNAVISSLVDSPPLSNRRKEAAQVCGGLGPKFEPAI
jgi:hypothetical protein